MLMSSSSNHTLVMDTNRQLWAFGRNDNGQLGVRPLSYSDRSHNKPIPIVWSHAPVVQGALGAFHTILLDQEGVMWLSREGHFHSTHTHLSKPVQVEKMDCGATLLAILEATGVVNVFEISSNNILLRQMASRSRVRTITCGSDHVLLESLEGGIWGLGDNQMGQLGTPGNKRATDWTKSPFQVTSKEENPLRCLSAGTNYSLLVDDQGHVWTTGSNSAGQQGPQHEGFINDQWKQLTGLPPMRSAVAGGAHILAIDENDNVWGWGCNSSGQLGLEDAEYRNAPQLIPLLQRIVQVKAGKTHSLAINEDGCLFVFGYNAYGQLGLADLDNRYAPVALSTLDPLLNIQPRASPKNARSAIVS